MTYRCEALKSDGSRCQRSVRTGPDIEDERILCYSHRSATRFTREPRVYCQRGPCFTCGKLTKHLSPDEQRCKECRNYGKTRSSCWVCDTPVVMTKYDSCPICKRCVSYLDPMDSKSSVRCSPCEFFEDNQIAMVEFRTTERCECRDEGCCFSGHILDETMYCRVPKNIDPAYWPLKPYDNSDTELVDYTIIEGAERQQH